MGFVPFGFKPVEPTTWAYLSSLLMLALFFKFNRFWSFRNFDLVLIILLAPGLLMVHYGESKQHKLDKAAEVGTVLTRQQEGDLPAPTLNDPSAQVDEDTEGSHQDEKNADEATRSNPLSPYQKLQRAGFIWLFVIGFFWLVRLLYDPLLVRKPMLEPNLSVGGLVFLACSLMIFLFVNVLVSSPANLIGPEGAVNLVRRDAQQAGDQLEMYGPGYPLLHVIPAIRTFGDKDSLTNGDTTELVEVARIMAILSQVLIVAGLVFIGQTHFGSFSMGVGMATVFLMLPYTTQFAGDSMHLLPGALLVWAVARYDRPMFAGALIGIAAGVCYYPLFLLPLWISFYWERGRTRFLIGVFVAIALVVSSLSLTSADFSGFLVQLKSIFGFILPRQDGLGGIWALNWEFWFRLPLLVAFIVLCVSYAFWPVSKDLSSLISCTAAAMVAVQYWHGDGGGLYMAWYLPLVLLVVFRPNLDHKRAVSILEGRKRDNVDSVMDSDFAA